VATAKIEVQKEARPVQKTKAIGRVGSFGRGFEQSEEVEVVQRTSLSRRSDGREGKTVSNMERQNNKRHSTAMDHHVF